MDGVSWGDIYSLFGRAIGAVVIGGVVLPVIGTFLLLRRTGFYGITLPQFAAAGVALGFVMIPYLGIPALATEVLSGGSGLALAYNLFWALLCTFGGLIALTLLGSDDGTETGRVAAAFAIASTLTILFAHASPAGDVFVHELLRGEILAVGTAELSLLALVYSVALGLIALFHRDLVLCSYDPEMAAVLNKNVRATTLLLHLITGLTVAAGVMIVGPVVLFGLLVVPPLAARQIAPSMRALLYISSLLGLLAALTGVCLSFRLDWPLGPAVVAAASVELGLCYALAKKR